LNGQEELRGDSAAGCVSAGP